MCMNTISSIVRELQWLNCADDEDMQVLFEFGLGGPDSVRLRVTCRGLIVEESRGHGATDAIVQMARKLRDDEEERPFNFDPEG